MAVKLHRRGFEQAKRLVNNGKVVLDERNDWSEHQPSAEQENEFIRGHGIAEFGAWHLGVDEAHPETTKGHYNFPYGDFWTCTSARSSRRRAGRGSTSTSISRTRRRTCTACCKPSRVSRCSKEPVLGRGTDRRQTLDGGTEAPQLYVSGARPVQPVTLHPRGRLAAPVDGQGLGNGLGRDRVVAAEGAIDPPRASQLRGRRQTASFDHLSGKSPVAAPTPGRLLSQNCSCQPQ